MKTLVFLFFLSISCLGKTQNNISDTNHVTKNVLYGGLFRQTFLFGKYERMVYHTNWTQSLLHGGLGAAPGDEETGLHSQFNIALGFSQTFGYKFAFLVLGVEPTLNFKDQVSFVDLNGIVGLRIGKRDSKNRLFIELGYSPKLYHTYTNDQIPFYLAFGGSF